MHIQCPTTKKTDKYTALRAVALVHACSLTMKSECAATAMVNQPHDDVATLFICSCAVDAQQVHDDDAASFTTAPDASALAMTTTLATESRECI